jgi:hypothetical protein
MVCFGKRVCGVGELICVIQYLVYIFQVRAFYYTNDIKLRDDGLLSSAVDAAAAGGASRNPIAFDKS